MSGLEGGGSGEHILEHRKKKSHFKTLQAGSLPWASPAGRVGCSQPCSHATAVRSPPQPTEAASEGAGARRELLWTRGSASLASVTGPHPLLCSQATRTQTHTHTHTHTHTQHPSCLRVSPAAQTSSCGAVLAISRLSQE